MRPLTSPPTPLLVLLALAACRPTESHRAGAAPSPELAAATDAAAARSTAATAPDAAPTRPAKTPDVAPPAPARVERLDVPGDLAASVVPSKDGAPPATVFLPGVCSNGSAYLHAFPRAAQGQGGIVALEGDKPCAGAEGFRTFSWDAARQDARARAALAAAGLAEIPPGGITIVGYSQGAALAEQMTRRWPDRYTRVVLIGAPSDPSPKSFLRTRALVTMSCDRDVPARMKRAARAAARAGVPATYLEMPKCTHGNVTDAEHLFGEAFTWLHDNARPDVAP